MQPPIPQVQQQNLQQGKEQSTQYPNYPPNDNEITYDPDFAQLKLEPNSVDKQCKLCPICDFPMAVRVVQIPCKHYMCYECYIVRGSTFCKLCNEAISSYIRLDDEARFISCDLETCNKHFDTDQEYQIHQKQHEQLNQLLKAK